jgi:hypothetical protein
MIDEKTVAAEALKDPWGKQLTLDDLKKMSGSFTFDAWADYADAYRKTRMFRAIVDVMSTDDIVRFDSSTGKWAYVDGLTDKLIQRKQISEVDLKDTRGQAITLDKLASEHKAFTPDNVARLIDSQKKSLIWHQLQNRMWNQALTDLVEQDAATKTLVYRKDALATLMKGTANYPRKLADGNPVDLNALVKAEPAFSPEDAAERSPDRTCRLDPVARRSDQGPGRRHRRVAREEGDRRELPEGPLGQQDRGGQA